MTRRCTYRRLGRLIIGRNVVGRPTRASLTLSPHAHRGAGAGDTFHVPCDGSSAVSGVSLSAADAESHAVSAASRLRAQWTDARAGSAQPAAASAARHHTRVGLIRLRALSDQQHLLLVSQFSNNGIHVLYKLILIVNVCIRSVAFFSKFCVRAINRRASS